MEYNRRRGADGDRISKIIRDALESDFAQKAGGRVTSFIRVNPLLSTCLGLAAGLALGMRLRSRA
jgi:hypothetical protein